VAAEWFPVIYTIPILPASIQQVQARLTRGPRFMFLALVGLRSIQPTEVSAAIIGSLSPLRDIRQVTPVSGSYGGAPATTEMTVRVRVSLRHKLRPARRRRHDVSRRFRPQVLMPASWSIATLTSVDVLLAYAHGFGSGLTSAWPAVWHLPQHAVDTDKLFHRRKHQPLDVRQLRKPHLSFR
jgi:hypothetical protein